MGSALGLTEDWDGDMCEVNFSDGCKTLCFLTAASTVDTNGEQQIVMDIATIVIDG